MANRSDITAGRAFVELFVKDQKLQKGLAAAKQQLQAFGRSVMVIGSFIAAAGATMLAPLIASVKHFTNFGSVLTDMSARTGVAADALAQYGYAAEQTGASLQDVEMALKHMAKAGLDPRKFDEVAASIAAIPDPTLRAAKAMQVWGKAGTMLLPMAMQLKSLRAEALKLGIVFTPEQVRLADQLGDSFGSMKTAIYATAFQIGAALAPAIIPVFEAIKDVAVWVGKIARENPGLVKFVTIVALAALAFGSVLVAIGATIIGVGALIGGIVAIGPAIGFITSFSLAFLAMAAAIAFAAAGFVFWSTVVIGAFTYFLFYTKKGQWAVQQLIRFVKWLTNDFRGLGKALLAGDLETAWKIIVKGMEITWMKFIQNIYKSLGQLAGRLGAIGLLAGKFTGLASGGPTDAYMKGLQDELDALGRGVGAGGDRSRMPGGDNYVPGGGSPLLSAATIGYSSRGAQMGQQVIGGGRNPILEKLAKLVDIGMKDLLALQEIQRKVGKPAWR